ncbi:MAG TPA: FAD binding domain-containing protein [Candidatus Nitrosocosmicus sp.]|nr:FAD binding domain-containing protein [Candidatus Nitrosocosmicus sp.]
MEEIRVSSPKTTVELIDILASFDGKYLMIAGCTDLLVDSRKKLNELELIIDLSSIKEMSYIKLLDNTLVIGAMTTFTEISESSLVKDHAFCLAKAAGSIGSPQIRNRATIGGNIANGSAAADSAPALLALDAWVRYTDRAGNVYTVGFQDFQENHRGQMKEKRAFIECIGIPLKDGNGFSSFIKLGSRSEVSISKLSLAAAISLDDKDIIRSFRLGMGSVGKTAVSVTAAEKLMEDRLLGDALIHELGVLLSKEIEELLKGRASMPYKKKAVIGLVQDLFNK